MNTPINLGKAYGTSFFAIIEENSGVYKGKILDDTEKQFYDPMIEFSHYDICLANLQNRFSELKDKEMSEISANAMRQINDQLS